MGNLDLGHRVAGNAVPTSDHSTTRQNLGDPERLMTARHALGHESEGAHAEQGAVQLLSQGASHDHRQTGAGEASWARSDGNPPNPVPATAGQKGINTLDQAVGQTSTVIKDSHAGRSQRLLHCNPETIRTAVQGQELSRNGVTHNSSAVSSRQSLTGAQPTPTSWLGIETGTGPYIPLHTGSATGKVENRDVNAWLKWHQIRMRRQVRCTMLTFDSVISLAAIDPAAVHTDTHVLLRRIGCHSEPPTSI